MVKKNCHNCKHLEWGHGDIWDSEGWCCNKRDYKSYSEEDSHLRKLEKQIYRLKGKKCCEIKLNLKRR